MSLQPLDDAQIAAHEAGHALVAHLMGDEVEVIDMYKSEQGASVKPVDWPPTRATLLAGVAAEMLLGFVVNPTRAALDMGNAAALPPNPEEPSARALLIEHREILDELRHARTTIPGPEVHAFLEGQGCLFGSAAGT